MKLHPMKHTAYLYVFLLLFLPAAPAQTVKQLENERKATLRKLDETTRMIDANKKSQRSSLNSLNLLDTRIRERRSLISTINREVGRLDSEIASLQTQQRELEKRLEAVKADYARLVQESYINRGAYHKLLFLFSAETFDQSLRRLRYLQEYAAYRKEQAAEIESLTAEIAEKNRTASTHRQTRLDVLRQQESARNQLAKDQKKQKRMLADLQKQEKTLRTQLAAQEKQAARLNGKIEALIAEEIRKEEERKEKAQPKTDKAKPAPAEAKAPTKEEVQLNGSFEANRGRLPWPVERGVVSGKFGVQPHPVLRNVTTNNKGIYIQTPEGADARSVFDGVVTQCFAIPGNNNAVIVKHGVYRTVYANLTQLYVKEGDRLKARQRVGRIYTDDEHEDKTELYFQLWKDKTILNPEPWIAK